MQRATAYKFRAVQNAIDDASNEGRAIELPQVLRHGNELVGDGLLVVDVVCAQEEVEQATSDAASAGEMRTRRLTFIVLFGALFQAVRLLPKERLPHGAVDELEHRDQVLLFA